MHLQKKELNVAPEVPGEVSFEFTYRNIKSAGPTI
jgi:hypothetical protein